MKILYINSLYSPYIEGGAEISLKLIVEGMKARGYEVVVLSLFPGKDLEESMVDGIKVYRANLKNFYWPYAKGRPGQSIRLAWHIRDSYNKGMKDHVKAVLQREKPDVVSCHNLAGWSVGVWDEIHKEGIPIVQVLHDLYLLCANSNMFKGDTPCATQCLSCRLLRLKHPEKSDQVNAVVGISKSILSRFMEMGYFKNAQKFVIHNTRSVPEPPARKKRVPGEPLRIGFLGTLSKIKGVEWLIEQFQSLDFNASLIIGGRGQKAYEERLKSLATHKDISFVGYVQSNEFYKMIDVLVVPSLWQEPLGMVAIEALSNNLPIIANKSGGLQETVIDRVNGLFCIASSPNSLGEALTRLYRDAELYNRLMLTARASVAAILSEDRMIGEYKSVMDLFNK
ncbi:MAG: glycosyltransferase family 4 protein [Anditalea sp.]